MIDDFLLNPVQVVVKFYSDNADGTLSSNVSCESDYLSSLCGVRSIALPTFETNPDCISRKANGFHAYPKVLSF